jgi:hypothetical protein
LRSVSSAASPFAAHGENAAISATKPSAIPSITAMAGGHHQGRRRRDDKRAAMRKRRPPVARLADVTIRREGDEAIIDFRDPAIATTHFHVGTALHRLTDQQILDQFNEIVDAERRAAGRRHVALEIPVGRPQIRYYGIADQWVPRGGVLRCVIDDSGPDGEAIIHVDDQPLSLAEFGRLLCTYAGWGLRITFVPEDALATAPRITVGEPDDR